MKILLALPGLLWLILCATASASEHLMLTNQWIRESPPGVPLAGYFKIHNHSAVNHKIVAVSALGFSHVMIHQTMNVDGVMKMQHIPTIDIPPGERITFEPGGLHLMLMKPETQYATGDEIIINLEFQNGHRRNAVFTVKKIEAADMPSGNQR